MLSQAMVCRVMCRNSIHCPWLFDMSEQQKTSLKSGCDVIFKQELKRAALLKEGPVGEDPLLASLQTSGSSSLPPSAREATASTAESKSLTVQKQHGILPPTESIASPPGVCLFIKQLYNPREATF